MSKKNLKVSVIITTYNRPDSLYLTLLGYTRQSFKDFEIIIADDGSDEATKNIIEDFKKKFSDIPLKHIWHPDEGFRRTVITNKAVREAEADYLIISDCDCIPDENFVKVHYENREKNTFLNGRRLLLSEIDSQNLSPKAVLNNELKIFDVKDSIRDITIRHLKSYWYKLINRKSRLRLMAANLSLYKKDFLLVNGFDERFKGWGTADEDLCRRLFRAGLKWKSVYLKAFVYHIAHPPDPTKPSKVKLGRNIPYYERGFYLTKAFVGLKKRSIKDLNTLISIYTDVPEKFLKNLMMLFPKSKISIFDKIIYDKFDAGDFREIHLIISDKPSVKFRKDFEEKVFWYMGNSENFYKPSAANIIISPFPSNYKYHYPLFSPMELSIEKLESFFNKIEF